LNGFAFGDRSNEIWDATLGEPGTHGILESYPRYNCSRELTAVSSAQRVETVTAGFEKLFPGIKGNVVKGISKCWSEDPWVKGAWAHLGPEQMATLIKPEKRVFFAGEHMSFSPSWMQGAIQSGLYAVQQISKLPVT
jgi:monoamine oxidase